MFVLLPAPALLREERETMGRKSRRSGGRAQLSARQILGRGIRNKQLGAKGPQQRQRQQEQPRWMRPRQPGQSK